MVMARYKSRLETVEKLRAAQRDERRAALAEAFCAEQVLSDERKQIVAEQAEIRKLREAATGVGELEVGRVLDIQRYETVLKSREQEVSAQQELLAVEVERRRQALVEADREVRTLEMLDDRHRQEHRVREARKETKQLDETAMIQQYRSSKSGYNPQCG